MGRKNRGLISRYRRQATVIASGYTGADPLSGFRYIEFRPATGHTPESAILYLHGSGERGESLSAVKHYGLPAMIARGSVTLNGAVICPLLASDKPCGIKN
ncbi:MAG: hypothetical protein ACRC0J_16860 [Shewanella oncorhynchi]